jgi:type I site-specific restriction-modification system R (restriction) subunit
MTEQEIRAEIEDEFNKRLDEVCEEFHSEMQQQMAGAVKALDDYKKNTESKLHKYRSLSSRLHMIREQKKQADIRHAEDVENILKEMWELENKGLEKEMGAYNLGMSDMCCSPLKHVKKRSSADANKVFAKYAKMSDLSEMSESPWGGMQYDSMHKCSESPPKSFKFAKHESCDDSCDDEGCDEVCDKDI